MHSNADADTDTDTHAGMDGPQDTVAVTTAAHMKARVQMQTRAHVSSQAWSQTAKSDPCTVNAQAQR